MVTSFHYECGREFFLQPLYGMLGEAQIYGIITIEAGESVIAWLRGTQLNISKRLHYLIPNKQGQGGQSQARFTRIRSESIRRFCKIVGEYANALFLHLDGLAGILLSGPGMTKQEFLKDGDLDYRLVDKILGLIDVGYSGVAGVRETIQRGGSLMKDLRFVREQEWIEKFFTRVVQNDPLVIYGLSEIQTALAAGRVATILVSDSVCSTTLLEVIASAERFGTIVEVLSSQTEQGEIFSRTFGGWGAYLRY